MSSTNTPESGQGGMISIGGNAFGVTNWKLHRTYVNAKTTVTDSNSAEEYYQVVQGWTVDLEVPISCGGETEVDFVCDASSLQGGCNNAPVAIYLTKGDGSTYYGQAWAESSERDVAAEDVDRYKMTLRGTGPLNMGM